VLFRPNKDFLLPDSCRATVSNNISAGVTEDTIERLFLHFSDNLAVVLDFLTSQDKHNIRTLSVNVKLIWTCCETGEKSSPKVRFSTCFYCGIVALMVIL
jgi:hypothetical protein